MKVYHAAPLFTPLLPGAAAEDRARSDANHPRGPVSSGRFASPEDHLDLIVPEYPPDRLADLALAGAPEQLPEGSATLLAGAVDGWRAAFAAWLTVAQSLSGTLTPSDDLEPDLHPLPSPPPLACHRGLARVNAGPKLTPLC